MAILAFHKLLLLSFILTAGPVWAISTNIQLDNSQVQATDVTYSFNMSIQNSVSTVGKLIVRFPADFETPFVQVGCKAKLNFSKQGSIACNYDKTVRMLTITDGFPLKSKYFEFSVSGITNPSAAGTSGLFSVGTYVVKDGAWLQVETEDREITTTTTPGLLQNESLVFAQGTMAGQYSHLTLKAQVQNSVPKDGMIQVTLPKWNPLAGKESLYEPYVSASANPGQVKCRAISGFDIASPTDLFCQFQQGTTKDRLTVFLSQSNVNSEIAAQTTLEFSVDQVRGPPTTTVQNGFAFATLSAHGNLIDQSEASKQITVSVSEPLIGSPAQIAITADDPSINVETSLNFEIRTTNPLPPHCTITLTIPDDFNISNIVRIRGAGSLKSLISDFEVDLTTRTVTLTDVNDDYIQEFVFIFLSIDSVVNPAQTFPTASFKVAISDSQGGKIEEVEDGLFFTAKAGKIALASLESDQLMINERNVTYTFRFTPEDSFSSAAILKLTIPDQIQANSISLVKAQNIATNATVDFQFGKYIYITDGFPNGYDAQLSSPIVLALRGFTNPPTITTSDPFELAIFYEEGKNEVSRYSGGIVGNALIGGEKKEQGLTITAQPSPMINMRVDLSSQEALGDTTGFINTNFTVSAETVEGRPIQMGSYVQLFIPADFKVLDLDRVASSCTVISGFSDEITCTFIRVDQTGYLIKIAGGFDSKTSTGGKLSFFMQDILNPFTTQETAKFDIQIFDADGGLQYNYQDDFRLSVKPSAFSYAFAESQSPVVGESSIYQLSLTLSVDTPAGAFLRIQLPEELAFDANQSNYCSATTNITPKQLPCTQTGTETIITISENSIGNEMARNGTTITVDLGFIPNPPSQKPTSSFRFETYFQQGEDLYLINQVTSGVSVQSPQVGAVTITDVIQTGSKELTQATAVRIEFKTQNLIASGSLLQVTLSNNFVFDGTFEVNLNGVQVGVQVNTLDYSLTMTYSAAGNAGRMLETSGEQTFVLEVIKGLRNPTSGPYRYNYFNIKFSTPEGYGIDGSIHKKVWINQDCIGNCDICETSLSNCTRCGLREKSYYFFENKCLETCVPGYYGAPGYVCKPCEFPCTECTMAPNLCTRCSPSFTKPLANPLTLQCYFECPDGTYKDEAKQQCLPCQDPCYTCTSATQCLSCDRTDSSNALINYFDKEMACFESCPAVSVPTPSKKCLACTENCKTCEDVTNKCLTCEEGHYLFKSSCLRVCPFGYIHDETAMTCGSGGKLQLPIPFTIIAFVFSIGIAISSFLKGADRQGRVQPGTAFFITTLAFIDILLRINWIVLIVYLYINKHPITAALYLVIILVSLIINIKLWRRMFYSKYKYEDEDRLFSMYMQNYPATAKLILNTSYVISFQAIRLTYSRILGKKQFMARFSTRRRYYRLIGRLSIIEILVLYVPSIAINICNLFYVKRGSQLFYFDIDSLILVGYATILIIVVMSLREKLIDQSKLFEWRDLFTNGDLKEENDVESSYNDSKGFNMSGFVADEQIEVNSAMGFEDRQKVQMYQLEWQFNSENNHEKETASPAKERKEKVRPVSVFDYNEYRKLEDKKDRIVLKKELYERKKTGDEQRIKFLQGEVVINDGTKSDLEQKISDLTTQLKEIQRRITETEKSRMREVKKAEQRKREQIIKKQGYDVPSIKAATDRPQRKASYPKNIHADHAEHYSKQFSPRNPAKFVNRSPSQRSLDELQFTDGEAGLPVMSSAENFTLARQQPRHVPRYTENTLQSEESVDQSLDPIAIASNEEGLADPVPEGREVDVAMTLKNQHLAEGASFGDNRQ